MGALKIESAARLKRMKAQHQAHILHQTKLNELEVNKARELSKIDSYKFSETVSAIGRETITEIARAGPEMQAGLLKGLGLKGFMITDGKNPINLFKTANGLVGGGNIDQSHASESEM